MLMEPVIAARSAAKESAAAASAVIVDFIGWNVRRSRLRPTPLRRAAVPGPPPCPGASRCRWEGMAAWSLGLG